ncbi:hypothetical protein ACVPOQ_02205 [Staphylococcus aureus]
MLYLGSGMNKPIRVQGTFVSDDEIDDVVDFIKQQTDRMIHSKKKNC